MNIHPQAQLFAFASGDSILIDHPCGAARDQQLETAKNQLQRAKDLGYAGQDPEYAALNNEISNLEKQIGSGDSNLVLAKLKDRVESFVKRQSEREQKH